MHLLVKNPKHTDVTRVFPIHSHHHFLVLQCRQCIHACDMATDAQDSTPSDPPIKVVSPIVFFSKLPVPLLVDRQRKLCQPAAASEASFQGSKQQQTQGDRKQKMVQSTFGNTSSSIGRQGNGLRPRDYFYFCGGRRCY